ncbi:hypothetical protein [Sporolactobacillus sp. KGMB 08714]|uniref:hypothetical protein n=1 Tax=Sporolactobacillus sp. KGMB 08714 TaxID=3064704 RepID=UPI002FBE9044
MVEQVNSALSAQFESLCSFAAAAISIPADGRFMINRPPRLSPVKLTAAVSLSIVVPERSAALENLSAAERISPFEEMDGFKGINHPFTAKQRSLHNKLKTKLILFIMSISSAHFPAGLSDDDRLFLRPSISRKTESVSAIHKLQRGSLNRTRRPKNSY